MELVRYCVAAIFFGVSAYGYFSFTNVPEAITVTGAKLYLRGEALLLEAEITNPGRPDRLLGIGSEAASRSLLTVQNLVIPGNAMATLQTSAAHGMLIGAHGKVYEGHSVPVTLWFESWGPVRTQATIAKRPEEMASKINQARLVPTDLDFAIEEREDGLWAHLAPIEEAFFPTEDVPLAMLYLNGLQLRPLTDGEAPLGQLPPGPHLVSVILQNAAGQRYAVEGDDLSVSISINVE